MTLIEPLAEYVATPSDVDAVPVELSVIFNVFSPVLKLSSVVLGIVNVAETLPILSDLSLVPLVVPAFIPKVELVGVM